MPRIKKAADTVRQPSLEDQRARSAHCPIVGQPQADYSRKQRSARALNHHLANATFFEHAGSAKRSGEMLRAAAPKVRIQLPPAKSLRTSGPSPQAVQARIRADRNKRPVFAVIRGRFLRFGNDRIHRAYRVQLPDGPDRVDALGPRRTISERRIDAGLPQIGRFEHVRVGRENQGESASSLLDCGQHLWHPAHRRQE
jgi:hypothetical protein